MCEVSRIEGGGRWEKDRGTEYSGSSGDCPGPGDRQVASGTGHSREGVSAAGSEQAVRTVPWASPDQPWGDLVRGVVRAKKGSGWGGVGSAFGAFIPDTTPLSQPP